MREIVVCGEALVDVVQPRSAGALVSGALPPLQPALGGGPFNAAITLGRLGSAVSFCSAVSTDHYGDRILDTLRASGVGTTLVQRRPEPTTLALAVIDDDGAARYSFYVSGTADRAVVAPGPFAPTVSAVCFGTLSMVLEPGASVYESVLRRCHAEGRLVVLDPNIRSAVIDDPDAYRRRFASWMSAVDVVKLSDEDSDWLREGPYGTQPEDWFAAGVSAVVATGGADHLEVITPHLSLRVQPPIVEVVDTIGAGDSVLGALLSALDRIGALNRDAVRTLDRSDWRSIMEYAGQVAAITVSRPGADPPWASEVRND